MSRWFRHYAGMMRDAKLVSASIKAAQPVERVIWIWGAILESAAEINDGGRFDLDPAEIAYFLRADEGDISRIIQCLNELGRLHGDRVAKWNDRQFQSDVSTDRVRAHRGRQRGIGEDQHSNGQSGERNDLVTVNETRMKRSGNAPETEAETNTEKGEGADAPPRPIKKDRRRATQFPDGMAPARESQRSANLSEAEGDREFVKFRNHAREKGRTCIDWRAAEANWYLKAAEFMGRKPISATAPTGPVIPNEFAVRMFKAKDAWNPAYGPEPGKPGCRASPEDLAKYGYQSEAAA